MNSFVHDARLKIVNGIHNFISLSFSRLTLSVFSSTMCENVPRTNLIRRTHKYRIKFSTQMADGVWRAHTLFHTQSSTSTSIDVAIFHLVAAGRNHSVIEYDCTVSAFCVHVFRTKFANLLFANDVNEGEPSTKRLEISIFSVPTCI